MAREGLSQARGLVWALRPDILEEAPLCEALQRVAERWGQDHSTDIRIVSTGDAYPLSPNTQITLLRILQEALANVHKHASATEVTVTLSYMGDLVVLDVQDDGRGFDPRQSQAPSADPELGGFGLCAMRERVEQLGGTLLIESVPGHGTTVVVEVPTCQ
jgi:signal transduction histidine kinase